MPNLLRASAIGHLGRDPEARYLASGDAVINFSIAVTEKFGKEETTTWLNVSAFGKTGEIAQTYLAKGDPVYVEGRFRMRKWTDKQGGERLSPELSADRLVLLGGKKGQGAAPSRGTVTDDVAEMQDDIPF